jgi:hypothetical protein
VDGVVEIPVVVDASVVPIASLTAAPVISGSCVVVIEILMAAISQQKQKQLYLIKTRTITSQTHIPILWFYFCWK